MKQQLQILIVEDDPEHRNVLCEEIKDDPDIKNYNLEFAESFDEVKEIWANNFASYPPDIAILDHRLSGSGDGADVAKWLLEKSPSLRIIVHSAYPNDSVNGQDASDVYTELSDQYNIVFLEKDTRKNIPVWEGVIRPELLKKIKAVKGEMSESFRNLCARLCAYSKSFTECLKYVGKVMSTDINVLLLGENGTGKEMVAREIHNGSKRRNGPFIPVNCAAIPEGLIEGEFFGYKKGAFSGAVRDHRGFFLQASGGTLFLDEVTEILLQLQPKLLRAIQEREIQRLGEEKKQKIDIRILSATNRDVDFAVSNNVFREDLYYRLNKFTITIPPLRERKEDIIPLAKLFIDNLSQKDNEYSEHYLSSSAEKVLKKYPWPGNVRQLENIIENTLIIVGSKRHQIAPTDIQFPKARKQKVHQKLDERKNTLTNEDEADCPRETIEEKEWLSKLDRDQTIKLCRKIWETKGEVISNKAEKIPSPLIIRQEHADLYLRAVLAIFFEAHERNKKVFGRELFSKIFGFKEGKPHENPLRVYLQCKHKNNPEAFPKKETAKTFQVSDLRADGHELKQNGIVLDVGGS